MDRKELLQQAAEAFLQREFQKAFALYSSVLRDDPDHRGARLGVILCDLVEESEEEATALFEYYLALQSEGIEESEEIVLEMVERFDLLEEELQEMMAQPLDRAHLEGISYEDFKRFVTARGGFKQAYEDIMFSTKVIITKKEDLFDFIHQLIDHGYKEQVYSYIEDASRLYPADRKLKEIFKKLKR